MQVQAEQALQNITAAMEQASGHRQEAAVLKKQLADDQVSCSCCQSVAQMTAHQTDTANLLCLLQFACLHSHMLQMQGCLDFHAFLKPLRRVQPQIAHVGTCAVWRSLEKLQAYHCPVKFCSYCSKCMPKLQTSFAGVN